MCNAQKCLDLKFVTVDMMIYCLFFEHFFCGFRDLMVMGIFFGISFYLSDVVVVGK